VKPTLLLAVACAVVLSACAGLGTFQEMDADHDGAISREEAGNSKLSSLFDSADDDRDGLLDEEEYGLAYRVITQRHPENTQRRRTMIEKGGPFD
jgi:Ca2+-binding EF-hand superfamily protein